MKKKTDDNALLATVGSVSLFVLASVFAPLLSISTGVLALLAGTSILSVVHYGIKRIGRTELDAFFEDARICINDKYPKVLRKAETENGYEYRVKMPAGSSTDDFERIKLSMEQHFDASINIGYERKQMIVSINEKRLKSLYPYELVQTDGRLEICIGYTIDGKLYYDIEKLLHLLIGAETGGGKSSLLRSMITSYILLKNVDLHLVDFQRVELGIFRKSKKVKSFCSNSLEFSKLLAMLQKESDKRLELFEETNTSSIASYNKKAKKKLRYKIVIIDEISSIMKESNLHDALSIRLAQDRKCGIFYIIATQYPIVKVVPNLIKQNMPSRCAFKVNDDTASRVILDVSGAEDLRKKGHGLLKTTGVQEFQAMYLSETQAYDLVKHTFVDKKKEGVKIAGATRPPSASVY